MVVTLLKLIYKLRGESQYNLYASQILMILIGLLKFYNAEEVCFIFFFFNMKKAKTDPELINKLTIGIKCLTNPKLFLAKNFAWLEV